MLLRWDYCSTLVEPKLPGPIPGSMTFDQRGDRLGGVSRTQGEEEAVEDRDVKRERASIITRSAKQLKQRVKRLQLPGTVNQLLHMNTSSRSYNHRNKQRLDSEFAQPLTFSYL